ncbi:hypothetical protein TNCV_3217471 [Trichonephila clavipes]|nr:hypothetical protein TNCV_3217471 [Trichonephila clavipes]
MAFVIKSLVILKCSNTPHVFLVNIRRHCCAFQQQRRLRDSAASTVFVSHRDAMTVQVSQQPVEMLDTQYAVDADLGTDLVSNQLVEMSII